MQVSGPSPVPSYVGYLAQVLPLVILMVPFLIMNGVIAKRKGRNVVEFVLLSLIPVAGMFITVWLASLSDIAVLKELESLRGRVAELERK